MVNSNYLDNKIMKKIANSKIIRATMSKNKIKVSDYITIIIQFSAYVINPNKNESENVLMAFWSLLKD